jgi:hypothetical protein
MKWLDMLLTGDITPSWLSDREKEDYYRRQATTDVKGINPKRESFPDKIQAAQSRVLPLRVPLSITANNCEPETFTSTLSVCPKYFND